MKVVIGWDDKDFGSAAIGGKARALGVLEKEGFSIPRWVVVVPGEQAEGEIAAGLDEFLSGSKGPWAVRSSASDEDGREHSFAGQLSSFLNVPREEVVAKVAEVRASAQSERNLEYRRQAGLSGEPNMAGVIVQEMVPAEWAGVAFSADPVTGRRGVAVVTAVKGLGESLVSGETTGASWNVERNGDFSIGTETSEHEMPEELVRQVAALARRAERCFSEPQDIEWAFADNQLWMLQSRPITSVERLADPDGLVQLWDNSNIAESYNGITTPLTFSFARYVYSEVYLQFVRLLRVPQHRIEAERDVFGRMLGLIKGRVYYNLLSWYRVLAMLPGYEVNRRFMEQMMGVREGIPEGMGPVRKQSPRTINAYLELLVTLGGLIWAYVTLPGRIAKFHSKLDRALALDGLRLGTMRPEELTTHFRVLEERLLRCWDAPLINDFFAMIFFGVSRKLSAAWCGDADGTLQNDLIAAQGGIISAEPARRIIQLASMAREIPELVDCLERGSLRQISEALPRYAEFAKECDAYFTKFGDRCLEELKLESPTLHDDPLLFYRSIGTLARRGSADEVRAISQEVEAGHSRMSDSLAGRPVRRLIFDFVISQTRRRVRDRENLRFERTRVFGRVRRIFVELGRRLFALRLLDDPRDIFYLTVDEVIGMVEGTAVSMNIREIVRCRRDDFDRFRNEEAPPDRFTTRGAVLSGRWIDAPDEQGVESVEGETRKGTGCCPGVVRGRARVVLDPREARISPGEILVAPRTDPGWILLFPSASGLLVEHGSLLSHSAIVAREMGIPAVVSVAGLTSWLRTGDEVELDGRAGTVTRLVTPHAEVEDAHGG